MIVWSGLGFLPVVFLILFGLGFVKNSGHPADSELATTFFLTSLASGALGWWLRQRPARVLIDKATGKEIEVRPRHALFFIPMIYWCPIFFAMGVYELIQAAIKQ